MLKAAWSEHYAHELPPGHRFPMEKYTLLPQQLIHEGTMDEKDFFKPSPISEHRVLRVHTQEYFNKLISINLTRKEERATGFPLSQKLVQRELIITQGTLDAVDIAMQDGVSANIAGGTHHAYADRGEGFCLLNDIAVGSAYAIEELGIKQILVVDLDVHQGNGTARIFENDSRVFTFSMHGEKNYPLRKEKSDLDVPLPDGIQDREYLDTLSNILPKLISKVKPELVFFQSGVDILATDKLGRLGMTVAGCRERDRIVFENVHNAEIPIVFNMGGGYSPQIQHIVNAHANTFRLAQDIFF